MDSQKRWYAQRVFAIYWDKMKPINERKKKTITKAELITKAKAKYKENIMLEMFYKWI